MKLHLRLLLLSSLVAAVSILTERHAAAQLDPYEFEVYPYATLSRGMIEIESDNAVVANGHNQPDNGLGVAYPSQATWFSGEEFTYGLTDRIEVRGLCHLFAAERPRLLVGGRQVSLARQALR